MTENTISINPVFTDKLETVVEIRERTGLSHDIICRAVRKALAAKLVVCRFVEDEYVKIPAFRRRPA